LPFILTNYYDLVIYVHLWHFGSDFTLVFGSIFYFILLFFLAPIYLSSSSTPSPPGRKEKEGKRKRRMTKKTNVPRVDNLIKRKRIIIDFCCMY
jgi:hypothetical protein